jgi:hypothetical protein
VAIGDKSVVWRRAARVGNRKARGSVRWLWPLIAPVGIRIVAACDVSWAADPSVVSPSGLPAQVRPSFPEPGLPAFSFTPGGVTGAPSETPGTPATPGTPGSSPASAATLADYQQYVGSYYGANEQCVSLTRDFDSALPASSLWQQGEQVEGATDSRRERRSRLSTLMAPMVRRTARAAHPPSVILAFISGRTRVEFRFSINGRGPAARRFTPFLGVRGVGTRLKPALSITSSSRRVCDVESFVPSVPDPDLKSGLGR